MSAERDLDELLAAIGDAPIKVWFCPAHHRHGRVTWEGEIAACQECGFRSDHPVYQAVRRNTQLLLAVLEAEKRTTITPATARLPIDAWDSIRRAARAALLAEDEPRPEAGAAG